jgi:hypothetical protein
MSAPQPFRSKSIAAGCLLIIALLVLWLPSPVVAQVQPSQTIGDTVPGEIAGEPINPADDPCSYLNATKNNCTNTVRIAIGMRLNLGAAERSVWDMVWRNPLARVGWPAEFEISRDESDPNKLVLIDMRHAPMDMAEDEIRASHRLPQYEDEAQETWMPNIPIGSIDDPALQAKFDVALRRINRIRALGMLNTDWLKHEYALCIERLDRECPQDDRSDTSELKPDDEVRIGLRSTVNTEQAKPRPTYAYVVMIQPDEQMQVAVSPDDIDGNELKPGQLAVNQRDVFKLQLGRIRFYIIIRDAPFDPGFVVRDPASGRRVFDCKSGLEPVICSALSGANIALPSTERWTPVFWLMGEESLFLKRATYPMAGGGAAAPPGFAPWQAQIFSTVTYSKKQILADKLLAMQKGYQRSHRCGGSLIAPNLILTAAHCVAKGPSVVGVQVLRTRAVRLGTQDLRLSGATYQIVSVVYHRDYKTSSQRDDIALVRIKPKQGIAAQTPIKLPHEVPGFPRVGIGTPISVLGWGFTGVVKRDERHEMTQDGPQFAEAQLQIADLESFDLGKCRRIPGYGDIYKTICAVSRRNRAQPGTAFSCRGDSGGPVIQRHNGQVVQVGLVSGGVGCGAIENGQQNPSRFVDLAQYADWIEGAKKLVKELTDTVTTYP